MRRYETLLVLHPELPEAQTRETIDRSRRLIEEHGGDVQQVQEWGLRDLAYPIRKYSRGYYTLFEYSAEPALVKELERTLKITDEVLRFVSVVAAEVKRKEQSARPRPRSASESEETGDASPSSSE